MLSVPKLPTVLNLLPEKLESLPGMHDPRFLADGTKVCRVDFIPIVAGGGCAYVFDARKRFG
jgi:hypothetical protein